MIDRLRELFQKLLSPLRRRRLDEELESELDAHIAMATEENQRLGMSYEEARRSARVQLGGWEQAKEEQRAARSLPFLESLIQDLRYASRTLLRDPGFAVFAILIVALGIGATATVFSVIDTLLMKPLPFRDPQSLIWIANRTKIDGDLSGATLQVGRMLDFRKRNHSFSDVAGYYAFYGVGDMKLTGAGKPERLSAVPVSQNFFPLLGIQPQFGRLFSSDECKFNGPQVVLLSHGLWERRFGSDPHIVGQTIRLDDADTTIVGVLPASFDFASIFAPGSQIDLFTPFPLTKETDRWGNTLAVVGRLKPGVKLPAAQAEANVLGLQITKENPHQNWLDPKLTRFAEHVSGRVRPALAVLAAAVGVVMLIVCANLSNLLLARTAARQKEIAVRAALGAGKKRLVQQFLTESLLLTGVGVAIGLCLAFAGIRAIAHLDAFNIPLLDNVQMNWTVVLFALLAALLTALVLGVAPALQVLALSPSSTLSQRGGSAGKAHTTVRAALVITEIAFACVLLVSAGLLIRSFLRVLEVDPGFRPESAATWRVDPGSQYKTQAQQNAYFDEILSGVRSIPGVQAAGLTDVLPLGHNRSWGAGAKGQIYSDADYPDAFVRIVSDGYLRAMGMRLKAGRDLTERDALTNAKPVIMINESLAHRLWPGQDPIGKLMVGECTKEDREVVGVVGDVRHVALEQSSGFEMYVPLRQCGDWGSIDLVVRSTLPLPVLSQRVEAALHPIIPDLPPDSMRPLTNLVEQSVSPRRFTVLLLTGFAAFALVLASLGIYGLISYSVTRRTQEIGIRMALGAPSARVQGQILLQTVSLALVGLLIGVVASIFLADALRSLLFGVTYKDPLTLAGTIVVMFAVSALAGYLPALRASRIDPVLALRVE